MKLLPVVALVLSLGAIWGADEADRKEPVRQVAPSLYQVGLVQVESKTRRLIIPASVNMVEGPIEYLLVSAVGKIHESILQTDAEPLHIHTAALLLQTNLTAAKLKISVELPGGKKESADSLVTDIAKKKAMAEGDWIYVGSRLVEGEFIAQRDGSIISIIADPDALIQSGRVSGENDENWIPRKASLPPVGTQVKVLLEFKTTGEPLK
jgi:hypothetical protein